MPVVLRADDTVERRTGRQITATGGSRDAVCSLQSQVIRYFGLTWVTMMRLVAIPWSRRVWALPCLTALCWPAGYVGANPAMGSHALVGRGYVRSRTGTSRAGNPTPMVGPCDCPPHPTPVLSVLTRHADGLAGMTGGGNSGGGHSLVLHNRANLCGLFGLGTALYLSRFIFAEFCS
jgi:hypothetical protein